MRIGGSAGVARRVLVEHPFGGATLHELSIVDGAVAVATSGVSRRSWRDAAGAATHHLLDPATGRPAWTGVVQVTALAPTALEAETLAKSALLAGPLRGRERLVHGGVLVLDPVAALALHGLSLPGDGWLRPALAGIAVPFAGSYRPLWTALGIVAGYGLAALSLSYYARARIGVARWRALHRFVAAFWLLGVVHVLDAGTDAGQPWFLLLATIVVLPPSVLLAVRWRQRLQLPLADGLAPRSPAA